MKSLLSYIHEEFSDVPTVTGFHLAYSTSKAKRIDKLIDNVREKFSDVITSADVDVFKGKDILSCTGNLFCTYQFVSDPACDKLFNAAPVTRMRFRKLSDAQQLAINSLCNKYSIVPTFDTDRSAVTVEFEPGLCLKNKLSPTDLYLRLQ